MALVFEFPELAVFWNYTYGNFYQLIGEDVDIPQFLVYLSL